MEQIVAKSNNGKLLCDLIHDSHLEVVNLSNRCVGKWTHVIRTTGESSRLDYVLSDKKGTEKIESMLIDEPTLFTPFRTKNKKAVLSDHNSILLKIKAEPKTKTDNKKEYMKKSTAPRWRLTEEGVEDLEMISEEIFKDFDADDSSTQAAYNRFHQCQKDTMDTCFKQKTYTNRRGKSNPAEEVGATYADIYKTIIQFSKKGKSQRRIAKTYQQILMDISLEEARNKQAARINKVVEEMTIDGEFDTNKFHKLRKSHNKQQQSSTSII